MEFRRKVETDKFGVNIEAEDKYMLSNIILKLYNNNKMREEMGQRAREIAEEQFDRPNSYIKILKMIEKLINK